MESLKYSLKTKQFGCKKRKIFGTEFDRESMSLEVHESLPGLTQLVEQSKTEEQSWVFAVDQPVPMQEVSHRPSQHEEESKTVKFTRNREKKGPASDRKSSNVLHAISVTAKVKVPERSPQLECQAANKDFNVGH
jgi:hypothetical protein